MYMHVTINMWKSEDTLWELVLSFYQVGSQNRTQITRLGSLYLLSCLASPSYVFLTNTCFSRFSLSYVYECLSVCICTTACLVPTDVRRGCQIPGTWSYGLL